MKTRKASDVMNRELVTATPDMALADAMELLVQKEVSWLPVVDPEMQLLGILTAYDIINFAVSGVAEQTLVNEVMSKDVFSFPPDTDLPTLVNGCLKRRMHRVPVVDNGRLVGMISRRDIMRALLDLYRGRQSTA